MIYFIPMAYLAWNGLILGVRTCEAHEWRNNSDKNSPDTTSAIKQIETMGRRQRKISQVLTPRMTPGMSRGTRRRLTFTAAKRFSANRKRRHPTEPALAAARVWATCAPTPLRSLPVFPPHPSSGRSRLSRGVIGRRPVSFVVRWATTKENAKGPKTMDEETIWDTLPSFCKV